MRNFAHTGKRNPLRDRDYILRVGRYPGRNHMATFCDDRLRGLGVARGRISRFPIDLRRRPYNTLALPCECVITVKMPRSRKTAFSSRRRGLLH